MLESSAEERGVAIELGASEPLGARGEERAVRQILVNLIANAIHHSPASGIVRLTFAQSRASASVTVADQGPGIAAADQQRIFERFERAVSDRNYGGLGLGLYITRTIVEARSDSRICSKRACQVSLPSATCGAATSSGSRRPSVRDRLPSRSSTRCCANDRAARTLWVRGE